jgi:hypothetical protein
MADGGRYGVRGRSVRDLSARQRGIRIDFERDGDQREQAPLPWWHSGQCAACPLLSLGRLLVSPAAAACHVPVSPRQRMGESGAHINDRGMGA